MNIGEDIWCQRIRHTTSQQLMQVVNLLASERCSNIFKYISLNFILQTDNTGIYWEIPLKWMPQIPLMISQDWFM